MRFSKVNTLIAFFIAVALLFSVPQFSFAIENYYYYDSSDDYEYIDEYGNIIEEEPDYSVYEDTADTSWFDSDNPKKEYHLKTKEELMGFASLVNEVQPVWKEKSHEEFEDTIIYLDNDITLTESWEPVGDGDTVNFKGIFDGQGHTVSGVKISSHSLYVGFFGYMEGTVRNLTLEGKAISVNGPCGAFAGYLAESGRIIRCTSNVTVKGKRKTGGIAGFNDGGRIRLSVNNGNVSGTRNVGGVVGENWGDILKCGNHGNISSSRRGAGTFGTGGVAGRSVDRRTLDRCFNTGDIVSVNEATGGVAGYTTSAGTRITNSYNIGNIMTKKPKAESRVQYFGTQKAGDNNDKFNAYAGGVVGIAGVKGVEIARCYNAGTISGTNIIGGIIGRYINESEESGDRYIRGNVYANVSAKGVGSDFEGHAANIFEGTRKTSDSALSKGAGMMGNAYENEEDNTFGNLAYPVLAWQKGVDEYAGSANAAVIKAIKYIRKDLEPYEKEYPVEKRKGYAVLRYFQPVSAKAGDIRKLSDFKEIADRLKAERDNSEGKAKDSKSEAQDSGIPEAIRAVEKQLEVFEKEHPVEKRKGYAILRYFMPVQVEQKLDLNDLKL